jgi:hypothetical protein
MVTTTAPGLFETIENLARTHHEHEKFYAASPLEQAVTLQRWSRSLKALAERWRSVEPIVSPFRNPYAGCDDLNAEVAIDGNGILFLEGEGEPAEIGELKQELASLSERFAASGAWLSQAMESSWAMAEAALIGQPQLADLLGERHRIIANDWQSAGLSSLIARLLGRARDLLERVDFAPAALRSDLAGARTASAYVYSATELIDHAADLIADSGKLVHDNEPRWRVFHERVAELTTAAAADATGLTSRSGSG